MMKHKILNYSLLLFIASFMMSCNDLPTEIGSQLLSDTVIVETMISSNDTIIESAEYFKHTLFAYTSETALIGHYKDMDAAYLCYFDLIADSVSAIPADRIIEAAFILQYEPYCIGDYSSGNLSFDIKEVTGLWRKTDADSLKATTYDSLFVAPANYFGQTIGDFTGTLDLDDTSNKPVISIPIDKEIISQMFDFDEGDTIRTTSHSFAFCPKSDCSVIQQLRTNPSGYVPDSTSHLRILYTTDAGTIDSVKLNISVDGMFINTTVNDTKYLYLQSHATYRSALNLDLSAIPQFAGIIKTELQLTLNEELSIASNQGIDTLIQLGVFTDKYNDNYPISDYVTVAARRDTSDHSKYIFQSLSGPIENIVRTAGKGSLTIYPYYYAKDNGLNHYRLDRLVFYGPEAENPENRPILKVAYSYINTK